MAQQGSHGPKYWRHKKDKRVREHALFPRGLALVQNSRPIQTTCYGNSKRGEKPQQELLRRPKHPEKRLKAAYAAFEEKELPRLKAENPNLRQSQVKQMLRKDWMKSPENPMNQL